MLTIRILSAALIFLLVSSFTAPDTEEIYRNYVAAINKHGTFSYYLVVKIKNLNTLEKREICTKGNFLIGALQREGNIPFGSIKKTAIENKERYFEFREESALNNLGVGDYSMKDLAQLEQQINFDSLARSIRKSKTWELAIESDTTMEMYAHALFNRGILTGESSCFGGTLTYVPNK
ncbi:MAG: hypothetical protein Q8916_10565 [Bacteroidota bacterium]|nr:hypothetical protein [Bacteroidota bacterium]MDP4230831.1 hypothetical protein [Bacteroidota bacterium]